MRLATLFQIETKSLGRSMEECGFGKILSRRNQVVLALLGVLFLGTLLAPSDVVVVGKGLADFLPLHTLLETFSVVVSVLIFVIAWESKGEQKYLNVMIVAAGFVSVAFIDFAHLLSYPGMPDFITPATATKSIFFWLCGRLLVAICLLFLVTSRPFRQYSKNVNYGLLMAALAVSALVYGIGLGSLEWLPVVFTEGHGLTPFKMGAEFFIVFLLFVSLLVLLKRSAELAKTYDVENIMMAITIMIMSESVLMIYADVSDMYSLMGHIFKALAYVYFYRALFRDGIQKPYSLLNAKNQELEVAKAKANAAYVVKSQFLANMSHEVRTPMNSIMGMAELLEETKLDEDQLRYVNVLKGAGEHLLNLVNDVLDLSRIEAGYLDLHTEEFDLPGAIGRLEKMMAVTAEKKQLHLKFNLDPGLPPKAIGDLVKFNRIVINLVGNAIKFTERGSVVVDFKSQCSEGKSVGLFVNVQDTGLGIPADKMGQLFQSFSQLDPSTTRRHGGTGLGLAISKKLVEAMNGSISVQSEVGKGSAFSFTVKLQIP